MCRELHRMMIRGNYVDPNDGKWSRFPDIGYSFCNCRNIFFTNWENVLERNTTWNNCEYPVDKLQQAYAEAPGDFTISMLDPFFINFDAPHEMWHWQCRKVYILWDMNSFANECRNVGFEVVSAIRDMDPASKTPQHFHLTIRKP